MNIGYASMALGVENAGITTCRQSNATPARLTQLIAQNLSALAAMLTYNAKNGIRLYRISSDIIPFGSHEANTLCWWEDFSVQFQQLASTLQSSGMRVSMHPGQYTVLNSEKASVVQRAMDDLAYHARLLDCLGTDYKSKLVLHLGSVTGGKTCALARFRSHFASLPESVKQRLVIENDDRFYHIGDVLETAAALGIPAVFDTLHHSINHCGDTRPVEDWIIECSHTWQPADGNQKIHYSQQSAHKRPGAHSNTIRIREFLAFCKSLPNPDIDVMLEVKDKNLSAVKCILCTTPNQEMKALEQEWALYKYLVLEKSPQSYHTIRQLLKDKSSYPALTFYETLEAALQQPYHAGNARNAALHVWGYFKALTDEKERKQFSALIARLNAETPGYEILKRFLYRLAHKYEVQYLLNSLYFLDMGNDA